MSETAEDVVDGIIEELNGRKGFDHWWYKIDPEIKEEIRMALANRVDDVINESEGDK